VDTLNATNSINIDSLERFSPNTWNRKIKMKYKLVESPVWVRKEGITNCPERVSFYGALPNPKESYFLDKKLSFQINDGGQITYTNYLYGKICKTKEDFEAVALKLSENPRNSVDISILKV
jgi:hypothetical protein